MKVLVTGAQGFIGRNLMVHLRERAGIEVLTFVKGESWQALGEKAAQADFISPCGLNRRRRAGSPCNTDLTQACATHGRQRRAVRHYTCHPGARDNVRQPQRGAKMRCVLQCGQSAP